MYHSFLIHSKSIFWIAYLLDIILLNRVKAPPLLCPRCHGTSSWRSIWTELTCSKEKAMAPHSSTLAWKLPWVEKPGRLQSMVSRRVRHDWTTSLSLFTFMHWRRKWQPTPVLLPGEFQGREPGGLPSMGSHRVGHDWHDLAVAATCSKHKLCWLPHLVLIKVYHTT